MNIRNLILNYYIDLLNNFTYKFYYTLTSRFKLWNKKLTKFTKVKYICQKEILGKLWYNKVWTTLLFVIWESSLLTASTTISKIPTPREYWWNQILHSIVHGTNSTSVASLRWHQKSIQCKFWDLNRISNRFSLFINRILYLFSCFASLNEGN